MVLPNITTKIINSDDYTERKILASDVNQIKQAIQTGVLDIKPSDIHMEGNVITADGGQNWIRRSGNKFQYYDAGTWKEITQATNTATFTAGENIAIRDVVYLKVSDGKIYKASNTNCDWIGVAKQAITKASTGEVYLNNSVVGGFTGLTPGAWYGLNATDGSVTLQTTPNYNSVGVAIAATQLVLNKRESDKENSSDVLSYNLAVTTATANINLTAITNINKIEIRNIGGNDCFIDLDSTATTGDFPLKTGASIIFEDSSFNYVSAITSAGTTTLSIIVYISTKGNKTNKEILTLAVTDATHTVSFTNTTNYKSIIVANIGSNDIYFNVGATATTSNLQIPYLGEPILFNTNKYQFAAICNATETSTIRILGVW